MPEYNKDFSKILVDAAKAIKETDDDNFEAKRTVLYLSKLSCEITLKALLEKAGKPIKEIRAHSHNLVALQDALSWCEVEDDIGNGRLMWITANGFRGITVDNRFADGTIGKILNAEEFGASKYPTQIRYGDSIIDFPSELWLQTAIELLNWANYYWDRLRIKK